MLSTEQIQEVARALVEAEKTRKWTASLSTRHPQADINDAYRIGMAVRDLKIAAGRRVAGHKIGLVSKAMRDINGAKEPDYGFLYDDWFIPEASVVDVSVMNRPRVEVELAFVMRTELGGPCVNTADVIRATDFILPMMEIVDGRWEKPGPNLLVDSIADAATCGYCVLGGNAAKLTDVDIRSMSASLHINGVIEQSGSARAVMGNPINAVMWLANKLHEFGIAIQPGDVVLSGSFIRLMPFGRGDTLVALFDQLGEVTLSVAR